MRNGDLSLDYQQRWLFVWENCLATVPEETRRRYDRFVRKSKWDQAVACWVVDTMMRAKVADLWWRLGQRVDILTTGREEFATALATRLEREGFPHNRLLCRPDGLVAFSFELSRMPEYRCVVHSEVRHPALFGSRGLLAYTYTDVP